MRPIILSAILLLALPTSNAYAGYIYDIFDGSNNDIGTLAFETSTEVGFSPPGGITDASLSLGGIDFAPGDLFNARWTIDESTKELVGLSEFAWNSPTFGGPTTNTVDGYEFWLIFDAMTYGFSYGIIATDASPNDEILTVLTAAGTAGLTLIHRPEAVAVSEPGVFGLFALGLAGLGISRRKRLQQG